MRQLLIQCTFSRCNSIPPSCNHTTASCREGAIWEKGKQQGFVLKDQEMAHKDTQSRQTMANFSTTATGKALTLYLEDLKH